MTAKAITILLLWLISGALAYLFEFYRPKLPGEQTVNPIRYVIGGMISLLCVLVATISTPPNNEEENDLY